MSPSHSPGPWKYDGRARIDSLPQRVPGNPITRKNEDGTDTVEPYMRGLVALVYGETIEQMEANARLIAAAPDLLAACKRILADLSGGNDVSVGAEEDIVSAIAKAEGAE